MRWSNPGDDEEEEQRIASRLLVKCANKSHNCFLFSPPPPPGPPLLPLPYETKSYLRPKPKQRNFHFQFS